MPGILILHARCLILLLLCQFQPTTVPIRPAQLYPPAAFIPGPAQSLEWMVIDSPIVVRGTVKSSTQDELLVEVTESIKGASQVGVWMRTHLSLITSPLVKGADVLLCLDDASPAKSYVILDRQMQVLFMDLRSTSDPDEILRLARDQAKQPPQTSRTLLLPRSNAKFIVPLNNRLEELGQKWAKSTTLENRLLAIQALRPFKSPQNIALILSLLDDTRALSPGGFVGYGGKWKRGYYIVRSDATDLLNDWRVPVPDLPDGGPILRYEPFNFPARWLLAVIIVSAIWLITCFIFRTRLIKLTFLLLCIAAAATSIVGWIRSRSHVDEIMFASKASHHEVASYAGGLQYVILRNWTGPRERVIGHFNRSITEDLWSIDRMNRTKTQRALGFAVARGLTPGPNDMPLPYLLIRIPYWAPSLPLLAFLLRRIFISLRQIRRRRLGLCRKCGYDLRENPTAICPECGAPDPSFKARNEVPIGRQGIHV